MSNQAFKQTVANWGHYPVIESNIIETEDIGKIKETILTASSIICRGNGRSYGDVSLNTENIFSTLRLNKFISFDRQTGDMACEAGVLLSEILEVAMPAGFFLPVTPGTKFITIGGAIACDIHGKNHHSEGCFSDHVASFDMMTETGDIIRCSRVENSEVFWATIGGLGLTGVILSAKFKLKKIETAYIRHESIKAENLDEIFQLFDESESWTYTVAWIDCLQKGKNLGRSIMMRGEHATLAELTDKQRLSPLKPKAKLKLAVPFNFPTFVLNTLFVKAFNFLYFHKQRTKHVKNIIDYDTYYYPLDAIHDWNKIYGKNGFIQYQFVIPVENGKQGMREVLQTIADSGQGSFLAVLKLFGKNNPLAYNSFPFPGYTLALDFKMDKQLPALVNKLDEIVERYHGRIYRSKDSMSKPSLTNYIKTPPSTKFHSIQEQRISNQH